MSVQLDFMDLEPDSDRFGNGNNSNSSTMSQYLSNELGSARRGVAIPCLLASPEAPDGKKRLSLEIIRDECRHLL